MKNPIISIIIPCFNQACYLNDSVNSVIAQTIQLWECIIVDDGSTDETERIAKRICDGDNRVIYLKKENGGVSSARNEGIRMARGTYILPLDADDKLHPQYAEKALRVLEADKKVKLVYCKARFFGDVEQDWDLIDFDYKQLLFGNSMIFSSAVFRKEDVDRLGGYRENMNKGWEDWDFYVRFLKDQEKAAVVRLNETLFYYRIKKDSRSVQINGDENAQLAMINQSLRNNIAIYTDYFPNIPHQLSSNEYFETLMKKNIIRLAVRLQLGWQRIIERKK